MADHPIWRKIEVRMWGDKKFRALSPLPPSGQSLWFFLLTGPHTGPIPGLLKSGRAAMAEELGWPQEAFDKAFQEVFSLGIAKADWQARFVWIPNAIRCNLPQSPNVITSWTIPWQLMPECPLKLEAHNGLKSVIYNLGESFLKAFEKACPKPCVVPSPNQEQEQEQEAGSRKQENTLPQTSLAGVSKETMPGVALKSTDTQIEQLYKLYPRKREPLDAKKAIRKAVGIVMAGDAEHPAMPLEDALDYLAQRTVLYARYAQGCNPSYIPYPASWFNAGGFWDDELDWKEKFVNVEGNRNGNNRAEQRQAANLTACAEAKRSFGLVG
jgi:hypothetical protein